MAIDCMEVGAVSLDCGVKHKVAWFIGIVLYQCPIHGTNIFIGIGIWNIKLRWNRGPRFSIGRLAAWKKGGL